MLLFQEHKAIPSHASARIQQWILTLSLVAYKYTFTTWSATADAMSELLLMDIIEMTPVPVEMIMTLDYLQEAPITSEQIQSWINQDQLLRQVVQFILQGLPALVVAITYILPDGSLII